MSKNLLYGSDYTKRHKAKWADIGIKQLVTTCPVDLKPYLTAFSSVLRYGYIVCLALDDDTPTEHLSVIATSYIVHDEGISVDPDDITGEIEHLIQARSCVYIQIELHEERLREEYSVKNAAIIVALRNMAAAYSKLANATPYRDNNYTLPFGQDRYPQD